MVDSGHNNYNNGNCAKSICNIFSSENRFIGSEGEELGIQCRMYLQMFLAGIIYYLIIDICHTLQGWEESYVPSPNSGNRANWNGQ